MNNLTLVDLLEAGVHFGHKKERSHPKSKEYVFTLREGIFVIDLDKTLICLEKAIAFLKKEIGLGKTVLFIGTKRQAKDRLQKMAVDLGMPYITKRFLGGTLTNFETVRKSITTLKELKDKIKTPEFENLTKKEKKVINDKIEKLETFFGGIIEMTKLPDIIFVIDAKKEELAVLEARKMEIPIVAICDTDADPFKIDYPIPANDDAPKSIELIMTAIENELKPKSKEKAEVKTETKKVEAKEEKKVEKTKKETVKKK